MLSLVKVSVVTDPTLRALLRSFDLDWPRSAPSPLSWDLNKVLAYLRSEVFQSLESVSFRLFTQKTLFFMAFAIARRVGELQALPSRKGHCGELLPLGCSQNRLC